MRYVALKAWLYLRANSWGKAERMFKTEHRWTESPFVRVRILELTLDNHPYLMLDLENVVWALPFAALSAHVWSGNGTLDIEAGKRSVRGLQRTSDVIEQLPRGTLFSAKGHVVVVIRQKTWWYEIAMCFRHFKSMWF